MLKQNGLSGKKIIIIQEGKKLKVVKEKNKNWEVVGKVIQILNGKNFSKIPNFLDEEEKTYSYEYLAGYTFNKVVTMSLDQIFKILDFVKEFQSLFISADNKVIVHGDLSQVNVIFDFNSKLPIKIIDWDGAYFGSKYEDIAYICWLWVNIGDPKLALSFKREKLIKIFNYLNYNLEDLQNIKDTLLERIIKDSQNIHQKKREKFLEHWYQYCKNWVEDNLNESLLAN